MKRNTKRTSKKTAWTKSGFDFLISTKLRQPFCQFEGRERRPNY
jgi:hypothetical protein